jgi:hypothetical protein
MVCTDLFKLFLTCHMNYKLAIFNKCLTLKHVVHLLGHIKVLSNIESEDKQFLSVKKKTKIGDAGWSDHQINTKAGLSSAA